MLKAIKGYYDQRHGLACLSALLLVFTSTSVFSRYLPDHSYETLAASADMVVILRPVANTPVDDVFSGEGYGHPPEDFVATNTSFQVLAALKIRGAAPSELTVLHFHYAPHVHGVLNGASFIHFLLGPLQYEKRNLQNNQVVGGAIEFMEPPVWLAFLKGRADGRFEPVTGYYDAALSFRELHQPSFFARIPVSAAQAVRK